MAPRHFFCLISPDPDRGILVCSCICNVCSDHWIRSLHLQVDVKMFRVAKTYAEDVGWYSFAAQRMTKLKSLNETLENIAESFSRVNTVNIVELFLSLNRPKSVELFPTAKVMSPSPSGKSQRTGIFHCRNLRGHSGSGGFGGWTLLPALAVRNVTTSKQSCCLKCPKAEERGIFDTFGRHIFVGVSDSADFA